MTGATSAVKSRSFYHRVEQDVEAEPGFYGSHGSTLSHPLGILEQTGAAASPGLDTADTV